MSGNRAGANGDGFASALAMALLLGPWKLVSTRLREGGHSLLWPRAGALTLDRALDLRIDVLDLRLAPQVRRDLLGLLVDHGRDHPVLDRLERGRCTLAAVVDPHDVPAELGFEGLAHLAFLQPERRILELRHHLPTLEEAELAALILRSGVPGMLLGELGEIAAARALSLLSTRMWRART